VHRHRVFLHGRSPCGEMCFSASPGVATRPRTPHLLVSRSMLRHSASRVHRCRRHSSSASSESLARYLLLPTASAPAKRLSAAQFLSPPSLLYVPLMPLFTLFHVVHTTSLPCGCSVGARLSSRLRAPPSGSQSCYSSFSPSLMYACLLLWLSPSISTHHLAG
jgi:hypothetical protein